MSNTLDLSEEKNWLSLKKDLKQVVGDSAYNNWIKHLSFVSYENNTLSFSLPTKFLRDWIVNNYSDKIKVESKKYLDSVNIIKFVVKPNGGRVVPGTARTITSNDNQWKSTLDIRSNQQSSYPNEFGAPLDPRFTFDNFVVGKPNELAFAASQRIAEADNVSFNPLFLYGGVGLGKTHLMHSIAWKIRESNPNRRVVYLSAEKFMYQFVRALRQQDTMIFKEQFRSADVLMIDDVQFIAGKNSTQEEFFHTFNALVDQNKQIIVSSDRSPADLEGIEERLRSRLGWGIVGEIHQTTYELRLGILQSKSDDLKNCTIPKNVIEFLAHKITSNIRELEGALKRLVAHSQLVGRPVSLESAHDVLHDLLRVNNRRVTIEVIQKKVAEYFNIRLSDMSSPRRARAVARPRQIAMYLSKQLTSKSLPEIGRTFGGRDHTTVMHAVNRIEELTIDDSLLADDLELLKRTLDS